MSEPKPFRFAVYGSQVAGSGESAKAWSECARKVEDLGYSTLVVADHIGWGDLAPIASLMAAATATTTLRLGTHVVSNDFRHPAMVAHETATLDLLSGGRLELGLGAGWAAAGDHEALGVPWDPPGVRLARLMESVTVIKRLFQEESVTHDGDHYHVHELSLQPKPLQRPHPPLYIGAGGRRILQFAAKEATIVGLTHRTTETGMLDLADDKAAGFTEKVEWIKEAAGPRFDDLELHTGLTNLVFTGDRGRGAATVLEQLAQLPAIAVNKELTINDVLDSPNMLIGTVDQMVESLQERRERYGISYYTAFCADTGAPEAFSPVVARLAGT